MTTRPARLDHHPHPVNRVLRRAAPAALLVGASLCLGACASRQSTLSPAGPAAAHIVGLWWSLFVVGTIIFVGVMVFLALALFRRRGGGPPPAARDTGRSWIVGGGIVMPTLVLLGAFAHMVWVLRELETITPSDRVTIEVVGHQWWWEIRYPDQGAITANEIHIPVGEPIALRLTSHDVIHSLWVPELHGKLDLTPGHTDTLVLQADRAGEFYGQCAEFCGVQHARMGLVVVAETAEAFSAWLEGQAQPAAIPQDPAALEGQQVFLQSRCAECHTVRGTDAAGLDGPDLTHLASRLTLAAGTLTNTPENLAAWVRDPHQVKPGTLMPVVELTDAQLEALLAYLATLQ